MLANSSEWGPMIQNLELKELCTLVLDRTLNDQDKYQTGLTKIFFRAGILAALEALRGEKLNSLAIVIQKNMRRRVAVKKYRDLRAATIKIQTWWRGILARRFVEGVRRKVAAIRLQTATRRFVQRRNFLQVRNGIIRLQSRMSFMVAGRCCTDMAQRLVGLRQDICTPARGAIMRSLYYKALCVDCASLIDTSLIESSVLT